jgi:YHYH protein
MVKSGARRQRFGVAVVGGVVIVLAGCQSTSVRAGGGAALTTLTPTASKGAGSPYRTVTVTDNTWTDSTNPAAVPLGDNKYVTTPEVGHLDSCQTSFSSAGGATSSGSWLDAGAGTWDSLTKPAVEGSVTWSKATFSVKTKGATRTIKTSDLPIGEPTGTFPISPSDPAYQYDQNPNSIVAQHLTYKIPSDPRAAASPSCTSLGPIGVLDDGVVLLNALDAEGRDAGAHELLDKCDGHPMMAGMYHYHLVSPCISPTTPDSSTLVGYALDGYGIYVERNAAGNLPTDADLDACHGRTSEVLFNNRMVDMYHYDATLEYPYTVGCYHGTPASTAPMP